MKIANDSYRLWTRQRVARLILLVHRGCDIDAIMTDALLAASSRQSVRNMCTRIGLPLLDPREASSACMLRLAPVQRAQLERLAARRGATVNALAQRIVSTVVSDGLLDVVLDDHGDDARRGSAPRNESPTATPARPRPKRTIPNGSDTARQEADAYRTAIASGLDPLSAMRKVVENA